jgi:hypothetical protein
LKKLVIVVLLLVAGLVVDYSLPLTSVATLTVVVTDQRAAKIKKDAAVTFLDADGKPITTVRTGDRGSWDNSLHWWTHSERPMNTLTPRDAQRATAARVEARNCESVSIPVRLVRRYEWPSLMPHGAGPAYFHYDFSQAVTLRCS